MATKCIKCFCAATLALVVFYVMSYKNYLLFHGITEGFAIIVSAMIFVLANVSYRFSKNAFLLFLSNVYLSMTIIHFFHILTFKGITVFSITSSNTAIQFWIAGTWVLSFSFLAATFFVDRSFSRFKVLFLYVATTTLVTIVIMVLNVFPDCYVDGTGLTPFKIASDWINSFIVLIAIVLLNRKRHQASFSWIPIDIIYAMVATILSQIFMTLYDDMYGITNFLGHAMKVASYCFVFNGIVLKGIEYPYERLTEAYDSTLAGWAKALELRDQETEGHSLRVTELAVNLAQKLGVAKDELEHIRRGALLHDIGKIGISDTILLKPGSLTPEEFAVIKQHPVFARDILQDIPYLQPALAIPYYHHEKWDGTGYPEGLAGEDIPLPARIFAIIDVWDALNSDRCYRKKWPREQAVAHLKENSGTHFDPVVFEAFLEMINAPQSHAPASDLNINEIIQPL